MDYLKPARPLDALARAAAERLLAEGGDLGLDAANGLERLGVRWEEPTWVHAAREAFQARMDDPRPLAEHEAAAFRERWAEIDLDDRWRQRLEAEGLPTGLQRPDAAQALADLRRALDRGDPKAIVAGWGRAHAWFGHVWIDGPRAAVAFDGFLPTRAVGQIEDRTEPGWSLEDLLGAEREFTLRRAGGHASMRWTEAGGYTFVADHMPGEEHDHAAHEE